MHVNVRLLLLAAGVMFRAHRLCVPQQLLCKAAGIVMYFAFEYLFPPSLKPPHRNTYKPSWDFRERGGGMKIKKSRLFDTVHHQPPTALITGGGGVTHTRHWFTLSSELLQWCTSPKEESYIRHGWAGAAAAGGSYPSTTHSVPDYQDRWHTINKYLKQKTVLVRI